MLPFMIRSRMNGGPAVVTLVGLFDAHGLHEAGDLMVFPDALPLDGHPHEIVGGEAELNLRAVGRHLSDGQILVAARDVQEVLEVRDEFARAAMAFIVPALVLSLTISAVIGVLSERRLRRINATVERIIGGELHLRLPVGRSGDDLDRLCVIVNRVLDRLEAGIEALRSAGENIAHDLRTPLTALRMRLERAIANLGDETAALVPIEQAIGSVDQALSTITALLRIADIQHGVRVSAFVVFDLRPLLHETVEIFRPVAEERDIAFSANIDRDTHIFGDPALMIEALANLVDNAIKFTPKGGHVKLGLSAISELAILEVSDTGPGIPPERREAVLRRFVRLETSRTKIGSGLGLSMVKAIADLHNASLKISGGDTGCIVQLIFRAHNNNGPIY
jgi:signal transduction histidine kinase